MSTGRIKNNLFRYFVAEVEFRLNGIPLNMNTKLLRYKSPTLLEPILKEISYNIHLLILLSFTNVEATANLARKVCLVFWPAAAFFFVCIV